MLSINDGGLNLSALWRRPERESGTHPKLKEIPQQFLRMMCKLNPGPSQLNHHETFIFTF